MERSFEEVAPTEAEVRAPRPATTTTERVGEVNVPARGSPLAPSSVLRLQRAVGNAATANYLQRQERDEDQEAGRSPVLDVVGSGGSPLDHSTRSTMERHLGTDLSAVRLHVDRHSAESVSAAAYTVGNDVVVHPDHFQAGTPAAQRTLAHELTHVVQQRSGPVDGTPTAGGVRVSDPADRFERDAERSADALMSTAQREALGTEHGDGTTTGAPVVQRQGEEGEEEGEEG